MFVSKEKRNMFFFRLHESQFPPYASREVSFVGRFHRAQTGGLFSRRSERLAAANGSLNCTDISSFFQLENCGCFSEIQKN